MGEVRMASWRTNDAMVTFVSRRAGRSKFMDACTIPASDIVAGRTRAAFGVRRHAQRDSALADRCGAPHMPGSLTVRPKRRRRCPLPAHCIARRFCETRQPSMPCIGLSWSFMNAGRQRGIYSTIGELFRAALPPLLVGCGSMFSTPARRHSSGVTPNRR